MPKKDNRNVQCSNKHKIKNPCKICSNTVTNKTGLQCKGACRTWMHYECLNYTPGRIKDIQAGLIKVSCPCPNCKNGLKEFRTSEDGCDISECPANKPCEKQPDPKPAEKMNQTSELMCSKKCEKNVLKDKCFSPSNRAPRQQQASSSCSFDGARESAVPCIQGDSNKGTQGDTDMTMTAMEQMYKTIGVLSQQIKDVMLKMEQQAKTKAEQSLNTVRSSLEANCSKTCHCPNNPRKK